MNKATAKDSSPVALKVGVARREITPKKSMFLVGYPHVPRISTGVHDPIYASAAYFTSNHREVILISLDVCYIMPNKARECRQAIEKCTGVGAENILISTTHTHSAPQTSDILMWRGDPVVPLPDPEYMDFFTRQIIESAVAAYNAAVTARLAVTRTEVHGVGRNRLNRNGPMDHEVGIFYAQRADHHEPLAVVMIYSMHPTVLHEDSKLVSSDFPHFARQQIEESLPGVTVVYHNGTCGNLSPRYEVGGQTFAEAERFGRCLGSAVVSEIRALQETDFIKKLLIDVQHCLVKLPARRLPSLPRAEAQLVKARDRYQRLKSMGAAHGLVRTAECVVFGKEFIVRALKYGDFKQLVECYSPVEVQALFLADTFIVGLPGELFVEYGLAIKRRASSRTFIITMANGDLQGYITTPQAVIDGCYEAGFSMFLPEAGQIMADAALNLIKKMRRNLSFKS